MSFKINKRILLISAVLFILVIIPVSFASEIANETELSDNEFAVDENTIYVSNVESEGSGSQDNPYNSVSTAVENFNSSKNSNIYIKNGNYEINSQIDLNKDLTIIGESKQGTVLDAQNQNSIFKISKDSTINLINLTLKNAKSSAIFLDAYTYSNVYVDNCIFENNEGSAIYYKATYTAATTTIDVKNSEFMNNYNGDGGAIYIYGGKCLNITNSRFEDNRCPTGETDLSDGGAIYGAGNVKDIYINTCTFINNTATRGSAISQYCGGNLYISNSLFKNNTSPGNSKYKANSSLIYDAQSNPNELVLQLNNNIMEDNSLNNDVVTTGKVTIQYLDKNTKLIADSLDKIYGDDFNYVVTLTDSDNNPLSGKTITVELTNTYDHTVTVLSNITDSQGKAVISLSSQKPGKYSAKTIFEGDGELDSISKINNIFIRTENAFNLVFEENNVHLTEGESFNATLIIYDEYFIPTKELDGNSLSIDWYDAFGKHLAIDVNSVKVLNGKIVYDINRLHLVTREEAYEINFNINDNIAVLTVDLSQNLSNVNLDLDTFYVSKKGNDTTGDGSKLKPLESIQKALIASYIAGGFKTIVVDEGVYEISTFNVLGNVTIIGQKSKTILKQTNGVLGMLEIANGNTVRLVDLTFIDGYATPSPDALLHVSDGSVLYIENCEFMNNSAVEGGVISISTGGSVYVNNSYFHDNKALYGRNGGVIYADRGYLYVANSMFENNTAGDGGAIYLGFPSEATIVNSSFINNKASGSTSTGGSGGAIFTRSNNLTIENSTFIDNYADHGGAIFIDYGAIYVYKSYFENNKLRYPDTSKGSAIEGSTMSYTNITMHYSVLISEDDMAYLVYIPNFDDANHTADVNNNYWRTTSLNSNTGFTYQVRVVISIENEYIYSGDVVEFAVDLFSYSYENGTAPLESTVHDLAGKLNAQIGEFENPTVVIKNNKAHFIYSATTIGSEVIYLKFNDLNIASYRFDVLDGSDKQKVNTAFDITPNKQTTIVVNFNESINGNVTIKVNDDSYSVKVEDSKAILELNTTPGDYTVKVIYQGDETYRGFIAAETFTVDKFKSILTAENITVNYNGDFKAVLKDDEGNPIKNERIIIQINGTTYSTTTDENGVATLELNLPAVGSYDVTSTFAGSINYNSSEVNSTINVEFATIKLTAIENVQITPIKGEFTFKLTDNKDKALKNTKVFVTFNNNSIEVVTDENGTATVNLNNNGLTVGKYDISAKVVSTAVYSEAICNSSLTVVKATAIIKAENITVYANSGELIVYLVDEDGKGINDTNVTVKIGTNPTQTIKTDEDGKAILKLQLSAANYTALINIQENPVYAATGVSTNISVNENIIILNAPLVTVYYSNGKFKVNVVDITQKAIRDIRLIVNFNGNDYVTFTDDSGVGIVNVNLPIGTYPVNVKFEGNSIFKAESINSTINVVSSIQAEDLVRSYNSPFDFKATLKDENGNPVVNQTVNLIVNGKAYDVKTDSEGVLLLSEKLAVGTYAITITNPLTGEKTANYAQIAPRLVENKNINAYFGANPIYKVRVIGDDGKVVGVGEIVKITINGKSQNVKTDQNGYASFKISLKAKTYTITATYKEFKVSNKVVIKPVLTAKNISKKKAKKGKKKFTAKLVNSKGKAVKGKKITFKIKGKTYKVKTNKKGKATLTLKNLKVGKYKITTKYGKSTIKNTIKIKK